MKKSWNTVIIIKSIHVKDKGLERHIASSFQLTFHNYLPISNYLLLVTYFSELLIYYQLLITYYLLLITYYLLLITYYLLLITYYLLLIILQLALYRHL